MSVSTSDLNTALNNFSSVISSAASSFAAGKSDEATMNFQREMNEDQQEFSREMWIKTNDYNTPLNQIARLKAAGLNPALLYGNTTSGLASSVGQSGSSGVASNYKSQAFAQQAALQLQMARQSAEIKNIEANTEKTKSETTGQNNENKMFDHTFDARVESFLLANKEVGAKINNLNALSGLYGSQKSLTDSQTIGQDLQNSFNQDTLHERIHQVFLHSNEIISTINKLNADADYQNEAKRLLAYNAQTARISANATMMSAKTAQFLAPYQAKEFASRTHMNEAQCLLLAQETYKAAQEGNLTEAKVVDMFLDINNRMIFGHKEILNGSIWSMAHDVYTMAKTWFTPFQEPYPTDYNPKFKALDPVTPKYRIPYYRPVKKNQTMLHFKGKPKF